MRLEEKMIGKYISSVILYNENNSSLSRHFMHLPEKAIIGNNVDELYILQKKLPCRWVLYIKNFLKPSEWMLGGCFTVEHYEY